MAAVSVLKKWVFRTGALRKKSASRTWRAMRTLPSRPIHQFGAGGGRDLVVAVGRVGLARVQPDRRGFADQDLRGLRLLD
jgi:hypothetical protein